MDDKKVFELKRLELAYDRQLLFMLGVILLTLAGVALYIFNIYIYQLQLLLVAVMLIAVGVIGMINIDSKMKEISNKIKHL
jgi:Ca2+/Na+ antiporter